MSHPQISIIIVNYKERDFLQAVLRLLSQEFLPSEAEVIVIDNHSGDGSLEMMAVEFPHIIARDSGGNLMYGKGNNVGFQVAQGDWLLILNPDVSWQPGELKRFVERAQAIPKLGAAAPRVTYPDGRLQPTSHRRFPNWTTLLVDYCLPLQQLFLRLPYHPYLQSPATHRRTHQTATLTGVCLLVPKSVMETIGDFDPQFTMYLEETDWQRRMVDSGLVNWLIGETAIVHYGSAQKTFAQASRHYLWGLEHYTSLHWPSPRRRWKLLSSLWTATLISDTLLLLLWPASLVMGRRGHRIRHYLAQYIKLTLNLIRFPTHAPPT